MSETNASLRRKIGGSAAVMAALLELELAGRVEALPGNRVALLARNATRTS